jgi:hypothetical protein
VTTELERTKRIADRLPEFYRTWDTDSVIFKVLDSVGRALSEEQKSVFRVMRTHWVDTANGRDLDKLGAIFELKRDKSEDDDDFRVRIKGALRQFKGGGTPASVRALMADFLSVHEGELEILENPEREMSIEKRVSGGQSWTLGSMSVEDASPVIEVTLQGEGNVVLNPALRNLDSNERVGLEGRLRVGQRLVMSEGSATLDGEDVSSAVSASPAFPTLTPGGSRWVYEEAISAKVGHLDKSAFGGSIFKVPVPDAVIRLTWSGRAPSTFALAVPSQALKESGVSADEAAGFLNIIKGAGVQAELVVKERSPS